MQLNELKAALEAMLFASDDPQPLKRLEEVFEGTDQGVVEKALRELEQEYSSADRGTKIIEVAGGFQMCTKPQLRSHVERLFEKRRRSRLSGPALETLAIVAYKQPITRGEIEVIRGVNVDGVTHSLLERGFIKIGGRKEVPGRPFLYRTTKNFLEHFGLRNLKDLPAIEELSDAFKQSQAEPPEETESTNPETSPEVHSDTD